MHPERGECTNKHRFVIGADTSPSAVGKPTPLYSGRMSSGRKPVTLGTMTGNTEVRVLHVPRTKNIEQMETNNNFLPDLPGDDEIQRPDFLKADEWFDVDITDNMLDVTQSYDLPRFGLTINGVPCAPIGGLHGITGQAGHGKTMSLTMIMAAYLGDTKHGMSFNLGDMIKTPKVLYCDTEMERENTMMVNLRVCAMLGWGFHEPHDNFNIMCLREEVTAEARWKKILKAIYIYKPNVVFIDGLIDIVADFNDNKQCQEIIFRLMAVASHYDISVWTVLHQNPGTTKMVGHAGSFLERKATDIFETKKEKNRDTGDVSFTLMQGKARSKDIPDIKFKVSDDIYKFGMPEVQSNNHDINDVNQAIDDARKAKLMTLFGSAISWKRNGNTWTSIRDDIKKKQPLTNHQFADMLNDAQEFGILEKIDKKYYFKGQSQEPEAEQGDMFDVSPEEAPF